MTYNNTWSMTSRLARALRLTLLIDDAVLAAAAAAAPVASAELLRGNLNSKNLFHSANSGAMPTLNARNLPDLDQSHPDTSAWETCDVAVSVRPSCSSCCCRDCAWLIRSSDCATPSAITPRVPFVTARVTQGRRSKLRA